LELRLYPLMRIRGMRLHLNLDGVALCCVLFLRVSGFVQQIVPADLRYVTVFAKGAKIAPQR